MLAPTVICSQGTITEKNQKNPVLGFSSTSGFFKPYGCYALSLAVTLSTIVPAFLPMVNTKEGKIDYILEKQNAYYMNDFMPALMKLIGGPNTKIVDFRAALTAKESSEIQQIYTLVRVFRSVEEKRRVAVEQRDAANREVREKRESARKWSLESARDRNTVDTLIGLIRKTHLLDEDY